MKKTIRLALLVSAVSTFMYGGAINNITSNVGAVVGGVYQDMQEQAASAEQEIRASNTKGVYKNTSASSSFSIDLNDSATGGGTTPPTPPAPPALELKLLISSGGIVIGQFHYSSGYIYTAFRLNSGSQNTFYINSQPLPFLIDQNKFVDGLSVANKIDYRTTVLATTQNNSIVYNNQKIFSIDAKNKTFYIAMRGGVVQWGATRNFGEIVCVLGGALKDNIRTIDACQRQTYIDLYGIRHYGRYVTVVFE